MVTGKVRAPNARLLRILISTTLVRWLVVWRARVIGPLSANRGAATTISSMCWTTWYSNEDATSVATGDWSARAVITSPARNAAVRKAGHVRPRSASRRTPAR